MLQHATNITRNVLLLQHLRTTQFVFTKGMSKTVGERIQQARKMRGLSGAQLAEMSGYKTQSGISNIENGKSTAGGRKLGLIAKALCVTTDWLLAGPDGPVVPFLDAASMQNHAAHEPTPTYHAAWPFRTPRRVFDALPASERMRIDGYIEGVADLWNKTLITPGNGTAG